MEKARKIKQGRPRLWGRRKTLAVRIEEKPYEFFRAFCEETEQSQSNAIQGIIEDMMEEAMSGDLREGQL